MPTWEAHEAVTCKLLGRVSAYRPSHDRGSKFTPVEATDNMVLNIR